MALMCEEFMVAEEIAANFVEYVNRVPVEVLRKTYISATLDSDDEIIGRFRIICLPVEESATFSETFYVTFSVLNDGNRELRVYRSLSSKLILKCIYNQDRSSWVLDSRYESVTTSAVNAMAKKLKSIL